ncbi:hypothetical protein ACJX0J_037649, partial [Zea mays]
KIPSFFMILDAILQIEIDLIERMLYFLSLAVVLYMYTAEAHVVVVKKDTDMRPEGWLNLDVTFEGKILEKYYTDNLTFIILPIRLAGPNMTQQNVTQQHALRGGKEKKITTVQVLTTSVGIIHY